MTDDEFSDQLSTLVIRALRGASEEHYGQILECLLRATSLTIAVASGGDRRAIDEMAAGCDSYLIESAVGLATIVSSAKR